ncbi:PulJ/GspJ family protein [Rhodoferax ferrireducens]|uniref:PulJ/GspJ family protein n=1 Tax=Rhodoferax ferrireducens TaxID=192843 RepID=UPI000E0CF0B9|nr:prepilin-type N-terminal cleavage/methylation domain-containing protein [Rhodoferax ferrireducens]
MNRWLAASRRTGGFTLIELLVAIALMALMAALSWRGLDGMTRAQAQMRQHSDDVLALQAGLAQWGADLDALAVQPNTPSLDWDGRALRILRRSTVNPGEGLRVVAWSRRNEATGGQWLRWQSPPLRTRGDLQQAWQKAGLWAQNPSDEERQREVRIVPLDQWQIFYYRTDAWSNPLSSAGAASDGQAAAPSIPDGIRLVLTLAPGQAISGTLTRDWLRPTVGGGK